MYELKAYGKTKKISNRDELLGYIVRSLNENPDFFEELDLMEKIISNPWVLDPLFSEHDSSPEEYYKAPKYYMNESFPKK